MKWRVMAYMDDGTERVFNVDHVKAFDEMSAKWRLRKEYFRQPWWWHVETLKAEKVE